MAARISKGTCSGLMVGLACSGVGLGQARVRPVAAAERAGAVSSPAVSASAAGVLRTLAARAAVIFAGTVTGIDREDAAGFVDVSFRVDRAVRGCPEGGTYVLREWAGLWSGEPERYRAGQRLLLLLAGRGSSGMSAPVGGMAGAIPLVASVEPPLLHGGRTPPPDTGNGAIEPAVDLRWIETLAVRGSGVTGAVSGFGAAPAPGEHGLLPLPVLQSRPGAPAAGPGLSAVLALLAGGLVSSSPVGVAR